MSSVYDYDYKKGDTCNFDVLCYLNKNLLVYTVPTY